jgi:hypothetical protein
MLATGDETGKDAEMHNDRPEYRDRPLRVKAGPGGTLARLGCAPPAD